MSIICGSAATSLAEEDGLLAATGLGGANARSAPAAGAVHGGCCSHSFQLRSLKRNGFFGYLDILIASRH